MVKDPEVKKKWLDIAGVASRHSLGSGTNVKLPLVRENGQGWVYLCPWGCLYDGVFPVDERFAFLQLYVGECVLTVLMCKTTGQCTQEFLGA